MERSPKGREIEHVEGNPGDIVSRGQQITALGTKMHTCADTLENIKNTTVDDGSQKGKAIDKLKDSIGDSYKKLREAGDLYEPVGPVIAAYGEALEGAQPKINTSADDCVDKWAAYQSLPGDAEGSTTPEAGGGFAGIGGHDADSQEAKDEASDNAAKKAAYDDWHDSAEAFDSGYDTWEDAFDTAVSGVGDKMSGQIKDSFWDNISSFVSVVSTILSWAALIVGVIAIFVTGLALLAAILAIASFLVIVVQALNGDKSLSDVVWAGLSIIPVAKVGNLTKLVQMKGLSKVAGVTSRGWKALDKGPVFTALTKGGGEALGFVKKGDILANIIGPSLRTVSKGNVALYVGNRALLTQNLTVVRTLSRIEFGAEKVSALLGNYGRVQKFAGLTGIDLPDIELNVGPIDILKLF